LIIRSGRKKTKTEINFWVMPNTGSATRPILRTFIDEFERRRPDLRVNLTIHPWTLAWDRLMDVVKGKYPGPFPDVIQMGTTWVGTLFYLDALDKVPDEGIFQSEKDGSAFVWDPGLPAEVNEGLYSVPWFIDIRVLYYRRDVFEKLNLKLENLSDWKGFYQSCLEIKKSLDRGGPVHDLLAPLAIPGQSLSVMMHDIAPWIWEAGSDFCSEDLTQGQLSSPGSLTGCEFYFDLINEGFMPIPNTALPYGNFFTGHYVMQFTGSWPIDSFLNPKSNLYVPVVGDNFGVAPFPAGPKGRYTFLGGSNLGVMGTSSKKELAWEFVKFLSEPQKQMEHAQKIGALTARFSSMEKLFEKFPEVKKVFWDSIGYARRLPRLIPLGSVEQIIAHMCGRVLALIQLRKYNHDLLHSEIELANKEINEVLSLHRYGARVKEKSA